MREACEFVLPAPQANGVADQSPQLLGEFWPRLLAQLMYIAWLKTGDDSIIKRVEQYNREDVLAMVAVDEYVNSLR